MTTTPTRPALDPRLAALLDRVAERQRADFGHAVSDLKADGSLITAVIAGATPHWCRGWVSSSPGREC